VTTLENVYLVLNKQLHTCMLRK